MCIRFPSYYSRLYAICDSRKPIPAAQHGLQYCKTWCSMASNWALATNGEWCQPCGSGFYGWFVWHSEWARRRNNGVRTRSRADRWHVGESHRYLLQRYRQYPVTPAQPCIASWVCSDLSQPNRWHRSKKSHGATGSLPVCKRTKFLLKEASQFLLRHGYIGASSGGIRALMPFFLFEAV